MRISSSRPTFPAILGLVLGALWVGAAQAEAAPPTVYVTNGGANSVSVVSTTTNKVVGSPIPVGEAPAGIAITPDNTRAYVVNQLSGNVSVIDLATNAVVGAPIVVGSRPVAIAITPNGARAYVANQESDDVSVIDTSTNATVGLPIPVGGAPSGIGVTPDGAHVYVANATSNDVSVIDASTNATVGAPIPAGTDPNDVTVTPDGGSAYVADDNGITVISTATNTAGPTLDIGGGNVSIAFTPDGSRGYVARLISRYVVAFNPATGKAVGDPIRVGGNPTDLAISSDGKRVYTADFAADTSSVISTSTNGVTGSVDVGRNPIGVAITSGAIPQDGIVDGAKLKAKKSQKQGKKVGIKLKVEADEEATAIAGGTVEAGGKSYELKQATASIEHSLNGFKAKNLKLTLKKKSASSNVYDALKEHAKVTANLSVAFTDAEGNEQTEKGSVRLKLH